MAEQLKAFPGEGPFASGYQTALGDMLLKLAELMTTKTAMVPVTSSNVESIGYDAKQSVMRVKFKNGDTYRYEEVSPALHAEILSSSSIGKAVGRLRTHTTTKETSKEDA
jgi:hypothetical protein